MWASKTWLWCFGFSLKPIVNTSPAASKNGTQFKSDKKQLKNN